MIDFCGVFPRYKRLRDEDPRINPLFPSHVTYNLLLIIYNYIPRIIFGRENKENLISLNP